MNTESIGDLAGLDAPIRRLFERTAAAAAAPIPDLPEIGAALAELAADTDCVARWAARLGDREGFLPMHVPPRGPRLILVHRSQDHMSAVHDHGTWVAMSPVSGLETHRHYQRPAGPDTRPELAEVRSLRPADAATLLPPDDVHDHGHLAGHGAPAHVLILLGDDQTRFERNEWDAVTGRHRILRPGDPGRWVSTEPWP